MEKDEDSKPAAKKKNKRKREFLGDKPGKDNDSGKAPKCSHCSRLGHLESQCWLKNPSLRPPAAKKAKTQEAHVLLTTKDLKKLIVNQAKPAAKKPEQTDSELDNFLASLRLNNQDDETDTEAGKSSPHNEVCNALAMTTNPVLFLDLYRRVNKRKQHTVGSSLTTSQHVSKPIVPWIVLH